MANTRRNQGFNEDLGYSAGGAAPDASRLAASIVAGGEATGRGIASLITRGGEAYLGAKEGKISAELESETIAALEQLDTGDYVGSTANQYIGNTAEAVNRADNMVFTAGETVKDSAVKAFEQDVGAISNAADTSIISKQEARSRIAVALKKAIAAMPGRADSFRAVVNGLTGRGDWDVLDVAGALTNATMYERMEEERRKAADKLRNDTISYYQKITNLSPDTVAHMMGNDMEALRRAEASYAVSMQLERQKNDAQNREGLMDADSNQVFENELNIHNLTAAQVKVGLPTFIEANLAERGVDLKTMFNADMSINYGAAEKINFQLAAVQQSARDYLRRELNNQITAINSSPNPRLRGSQRQSLIENIEKQYKEMEDIVERNPGTLFALSKAAQDGRAGTLQSLMTNLKLMNDVVDSMGGQAMAMAYFANPTVFKNNFPQQFELFEKYKQIGTNVLDAGFISSWGARERTLSEQGRNGRDDVDVPKAGTEQADVDYTARTNLANVAAQTIEAIGQGKDITMNDDLVGAVVQFVAQANLSPAFNTRLNKSIADGSFDKMLEKMSPEQKQRLSEATLQAWSKRVLEAGPLTILDRLKKSYEGGATFDGTTIILNYDKDNASASNITNRGTMTYDETSGTIRFTGNVQTRKVFTQLIAAARVNAQVLNKLGVLDEKAAMQSMFNGIANTLTGGRPAPIDPVATGVAAGRNEQEAANAPDELLPINYEYKASDGKTYRFRGGNPNTASSWEVVGE
jgi:hypothetical protein